MNELRTELKSKSYLQHRKQRRWQIYLPLGLGIVITLALMVWILLTASGRAPGGIISSGADTALIWLILPALVFALVAILVLFGLVYLLAKILNLLPSYTYLGQQYADLVAAQVTYWANMAVKPVFEVRAVAASIKALFKELFGRSEK
jgi:hypothetical protein